MMPDIAAVLTWLVAYMIGSIPFGYLAGWMRGINLFEAGSGNVGATNATRVLGKRVGAVVFLCDWLKGVIPVFFAPAIAQMLGGAAITDAWLQAGAAAGAFLGHVFPPTLGFCGGKGVATGSGVAAVIAPIPTAVAFSLWLLTLLSVRMVSAASLVAVTTLLIGQFGFTPDPLGRNLPGSLLCCIGGLLVAIRHRSNVRRIMLGTEPRTADFPTRRPLLFGLHSLALGMWFGGAAFFSFGAAPVIFSSFTEVVAGSPSDRTAGLDIVPTNATIEQKQALASALAGAAVGPVFPRFFAMQTVAASIALVTLLGVGEPRRWRVWLVVVGLILICVGWPISERVSAIRLARTGPDATLRAKAKQAFGPWHLVSLGLSAVTTAVAAAALATARLTPMPER